MILKLFSSVLISLFISICYIPNDVSASSNTNVYVTKSGKKYHYKHCKTLARSRHIYKISIQEAQQRGYTACKVCRPSIGICPKTKHSVSNYTGKCYAISDGDTIKVNFQGLEYKIRLYGIDCPESGQLFGTPAKQKTTELVLNKNVQIQVIDVDRYGRQVGIVTIGNKILQEELLKSGLTWVYPQYCKIPQCADWEKLEKQAEEKKIGIWKNENSIPPWEWRRI